MTITEANAVNVLLRHALALPPVPNDAAAQDAAAVLTAKANKVLGAGLRPDDVRAAWPEAVDL